MIRTACGLTFDNVLSTTLVLPNFDRLLHTRQSSTHLCEQRLMESQYTNVPISRIISSALACPFAFA